LIVQLAVDGLGAAIKDLACGDGLAARLVGIGNAE
jgi:hypothetical protein